MPVHSSLTARGHLEFCHETSAQRMQYALRFVFVTALAIAIAGESSPGLLRQYGVLLLYLIAIMAASAIWNRSRTRSRSLTALCMGLTDFIVIIALQELCEGSPLLIVALFFPPILAAFQGRPELTAATIGGGSVLYCGFAVFDPAVFLTANFGRIVGIVALYGLVSACCVAHSMTYAKHISKIAQLLSDRSFLLAEVISAEERERARLAEFIHDGPLQSVLAARFVIEQAAGEMSEDIIRRTGAELLGAARQLRLTTGQLYPEVLKEIGLVDAIRALLRAMRERTGIEYSLTTKYTCRKPFESLVFAAARELIENVVRHSHATRVWVDLGENSDSLALTVTDNGIGTDAKVLHERLCEGHIGLASLRVRVEAAGGTFEYISILPAPGTRVRVTLPFMSVPRETPDGTSCSKRLRSLIRRRNLILDANQGSQSGP